MTLTVKAVNSLAGSINLPASKSYSIRAFLIASLGGTSEIINPSDCDDARVSIQVARQLGAQVISLGRNRWRVKARKNKLKLFRINVKESGTVLRFLLPLLALKGGRFTVVGEGTLKSRPNLFLNQTLREMGVEIKGKGPNESVPIVIDGKRVHGGRVSIDGTLSSQFISALLIASPLLKEDTHLKIKGKRIVSRTYVTMTQQVLHKAGIRIKKSGERSFTIKGNQKFKGLKSFRIPSDYGLAAFFLVAAALTKSKVVLKGYLKDDLVQADSAIVPFLRKMGTRFSKTTSGIKISGPSKLKGGSFSLRSAPDLVPIMAIVALFAKGKTRLYDIKHVRTKESDRISDLRRELLKIGAKITEKENELVVTPRASYRGNVLLDPHHDHRLAMAFSILGLKIGAGIKDIECVSKSYPGFVKDLKALGVCIA